MARPTQNLSARFTIRITPDEEIRIRENADVAGIEVAAFIRMQLLGAEVPRRARRKSADHQTLARILAQLGKIGGNLNQAMHAANMSGDAISYGEIMKLKSELSATRQLVHDALAL